MQSGMSTNEMKVISICVIFVKRKKKKKGKEKKKGKMTPEHNLYNIMKQGYRQSGTNGLFSCSTEKIGQVQK